jgi:hypothetical protein
VVVVVGGGDVVVVVGGGDVVVVVGDGGLLVVVVGAVVVFLGGCVVVLTGVVVVVPKNGDVVVVVAVCFGALFRVPKDPVKWSMLVATEGALDPFNGAVFFFDVFRVVALAMEDEV